jgi:hypothetical protein
MCLEVEKSLPKQRVSVLFSQTSLLSKPKELCLTHQVLSLRGFPVVFIKVV